jgi:hypothetical protein
LKLLFAGLYRLPNEQYAVSIELTSGADAVRAFIKFASLRIDEFMLFGPTLVLRCRSESWTRQLTPRAGVDLHSRTAILRHVTGILAAYMRPTLPLMYVLGVVDAVVV